MAGKKDLVEAQAFSRRRLLTAFVSGAPGGRELEPTKPLRGVVTGLVLAVLLVLGSLGFGLLSPGLAPGWDDNRLVLTDSGARYVALGGTLHPVLNTASARLLIATRFEVVRTSDERIADAPRGATAGIPGAPDALPAADALVGDGWLSCVGATGATATVLSTGAVAQAVAAEQSALEAAVAAGEQGPAAALVSGGGREYLVTEGRRHLVPAGSRDAVLRALGLPTARPWAVDAAWLALFPPGSDLEAIVLPEAGSPVPNALAAPPGATVGSVLRVTDAAGEGAEFWVIDAAGELAPLSDVALGLYRLGAGAAVGPDIEVTAAQVSGLPTAEEAIAPADWPRGLPALAAEGTVCGRLATAGADGLPRVHLVPTAEVALPDDGTRVLIDPSGGALVLPVSGGPDATGWVHLVDASGTAYPLPVEAETVVARLGYGIDQVVRVPEEWLALFAVGPALTVEAARATHGPGAAPAPDGATAATPDATPDATDDACTPGVRRLVAEPPAALAQLGAAGAWEVATGAGVTVAVVDSGVEARNEHLGDAVLPGVDLTAGPASGDGRTDVAVHGTAVAGVVAARPVDGSGLVGLAPGATVLPVRVYTGVAAEPNQPAELPSVDVIAAGIRWAVDEGARVINVSLSAPAGSPALADAVAHATARGSLVVASAGNRAGDEPDAPRYPAAYPDVLGVTALAADGTVTDAVVHGAHVDLAAPGQGVLTAYLADGDCVLAGDQPSTSYAAAYVSAAAALVAERYPDETPAQWAHRLTSTAARPFAAERTDTHGWGIVRPYSALTFVDDGTAPGPPSPVHGAVAPATGSLAPVALRPADDPSVAARSAATWWVLAAAVAVTGAVLLGVPVRRRRTADGRRAAASQRPDRLSGSTGA